VTVSPASTTQRSTIAASVVIISYGIKRQPVATPAMSIAAASARNQALATSACRISNLQKMVSVNAQAI